MPNGNIGQTVVGVGGQTLTLSYKGGEKKIMVPSDTPIVSIAPGERTDLKPGAKIFIVAAKRQADRTLLAPPLPQALGTAVSEGVFQLRDGVNDSLSWFAEITRLHPDADPLQALLDGKTDIAVVTTSSLSAVDVDRLKIFDLPYFFSDLGDAIAVQKSSVGDGILASLHKLYRCLGAAGAIEDLPRQPPTILPNDCLEISSWPHKRS
jgi:hypothetical protein